MVFEQSKFNCASVTASVRLLNQQTTVDNSLAPKPSTPARDRYKISWVCGISNPCSLIHLLLRLRSGEINDQAPSLAKIHQRRWSLGTRLPSLHVITKTLCIWWLRTPQLGFITMCIWRVWIVGVSQNMLPNSYCMYAHVTIKCTCISAKCTYIQHWLHDTWADVMMMSWRYHLLMSWSLHH